MHRFVDHLGALLRRGIRIDDAPGRSAPDEPLVLGLDHVQQQRAFLVLVDVDVVEVDVEVEEEAKEANVFIPPVPEVKEEMLARDRNADVRPKNKSLRILVFNFLFTLS